MHGQTDRVPTTGSSRAMETRHFFQRKQKEKENRETSFCKKMIPGRGRGAGGPRGRRHGGAQRAAGRGLARRRRPSEAETSDSVGWQTFGKMLLVFGCNGSDFCKKICVLQHFSKSTRFSC